MSGVKRLADLVAQDRSAQLKLLDVIGRRWAPRVLWELRGGALGFAELRIRCDSMSTSVLSARLRELVDVDLVVVDDFGSWELTDRGLAVGTALDAATNTALDAATNTALDAASNTALDAATNTAL